MKGSEITNYNKCVGCSLCESICPKKCISMQYDSEGFKRPVVDEATCINCKKCQKLCPVNHNVFNLNDYTQKAFLAIAKNKEIYNNSSSGGMFYIIAKSVIERGGIVFGAAFDKNFKLFHIGVEKIEDIDCLMGSKYLQSDLSNIWEDLNSSLKSGRLVLFSGTPCQIGAIKSKYPGIVENLIIIDVICMGVPSPILFEKYTNEISASHKGIKSISFRDKKYFGHERSHSLIIKFKDGKIYARTRMDDPYFFQFLQCNTLRPSCYDCSFKSKQRASDITLADCWSLRDLIQVGQGEKVVSLVICNTSLGMNKFEEISEYIDFQEIPLDRVFKAQPMMTTSCKQGNSRNFLLKEALESESTVNYLKEIGKIGLKNGFKSFLTHLIYQNK